TGIGQGDEYRIRVSKRSLCPSPGLIDKINALFVRIKHAGEGLVCHGAIRLGKYFISLDNVPMLRREYPGVHTDPDALDCGIQVVPFPVIRLPGPCDIRIFRRECRCIRMSSLDRETDWVRFSCNEPVRHPAPDSHAASTAKRRNDCR